MCKNGYDTRIGGELFDSYVRYCTKHLGKLHDAANADPDKYSTEEKPIIAAADIEISLIPKIRKLYSGVTEYTSEDTKKVIEILETWVSKRHEKHLRVQERMHTNIIEVIRKANDESWARLKAHREANPEPFNLTDFGFGKKDNGEDKLIDRDVLRTFLREHPNFLREYFYVEHDPSKFKRSRRNE